MAVQGENPTYMTASNVPKSSGSSKPTLLAFHGSGSNALCHGVQLARLMRILRPHFEVENLEAPFASPAGPGILPFFEGCGPFKRWLPPTEKVTIEAMRQGLSSNAMAPEVEEIVRETVQRVRSSGSRVVGLIGFSQGTRVVAGLLQACEIRRALGIQGEDWCDFEFGLSVCPSYPPPIIPPSIAKALSESSLSAEEQKSLVAKKIEVPSLIVIGKKDEWNWAGQAMIEKHYVVQEGSSSELMECDNGHVYPVLPEESEKMGQWMVEVLKKSEEGRVGR